MTAEHDAGGDWEESASRRRAGAADLERPRLAAPQGVVARPGRGQVTLDWEPVEGAAGYLVRRADQPDGELLPLEIGEPWVRPVPHPPLTDTTGKTCRPAWYTVAAVAAVDDHGQPASAPPSTITASPPARRCRRLPEPKAGHVATSSSGPPTCSDRSTGPGGR